jgi:hypothetical protein
VRREHLHGGMPTAFTLHTVHPLPPHPSTLLLALGSSSESFPPQIMALGISMMSRWSYTSSISPSHPRTPLSSILILLLLASLLPFTISPFLAFAFSSSSPSHPHYAPHTCNLIHTRVRTHIHTHKHTHTSCFSSSSPHRARTHTRAYSSWY